MAEVWLKKISVDERWVHKIPDNLPLDEAALIEPLSVGYHAVERANLSEKSTVLVVGAGPIGLLTAAVAKAQGHTVIISEPSGLRRKKKHKKHKLLIISSIQLKMTFKLKFMKLMKKEWTQPLNVPLSNRDLTLV